MIGTRADGLPINLSDPGGPDHCPGKRFHSERNAGGHSYLIKRQSRPLTFNFNTSPVTSRVSNTMDIPAGAIHQASDGDPNLEFNCTFRYAATPLAVTDTDPPVGGTFYAASARRLYV